MSRLSDRIMDCLLPLERVESWSCLRPTQPRKLRCQRTRGAFKNDKKRFAGRKVIKALRVALQVASHLATAAICKRLIAIFTVLVQRMRSVT